MTQPRNYTAADKAAAARRLAARHSTAKLRRLQSLNEAQTGLAYDAGNDDGLANLQAMAEVYATAIDIREFQP